MLFSFNFDRLIYTRTLAAPANAIGPGPRVIVTVQPFRHDLSKNFYEIIRDGSHVRL